jgi:ATP-dependent helicase/nuclease subunit A
MSEQLGLFEDGVALPQGGRDPVDEDARRVAVDPRENVVLEASAGTGKTRVLVERYLNLLRAGVEPANILAITFTRKAAAEMHERIVQRLREEARLSADGRTRWRDLRDRLGEIAVSTIDAFCLSLLREFPLEANLDPGFDVADETEVPRLVELALDRTLRACVGRAPHEPELALILAQLGTSKARVGLAHLLSRRLVARGALERFLARGPRDLTIERACERALKELRLVLDTLPGGLERFLADGPVRHPKFQLLARTLRRLPDLGPSDAAAVRAALDRVRDHFLTQEGRPRRDRIHPYSAEHATSGDRWRRHRQAVTGIASSVSRVLDLFDHDLNAILARAARAMFAIAEREYRRALDERSVLDFADLVDRALHLLGQMDEFAQSRFRLESRYHHVLVDEFQDTSRAQWALVAKLIQSWGEGFGLVHDAPLQPSIFIVGDRKQSIYRFRDAEVAVMDDAAAFIEGLRPEGRARRSIRQSLRAGPRLLAFVNDVFHEVRKAEGRRGAFRFDETDRFPVHDVSAAPHASAEPVLGLTAASDPEGCAAAVADEIVRLCREETVRDRQTGLTRATRPSDIAILFRSRVSHREFEEALETRGVAAYVYKGLGFFDADEIKDLAALLRYLADPTSDLRAAALWRSRLFRLSDGGLLRLAPGLAAALAAPSVPAAAAALSSEDRAVLELARASVARWLALVDRVPLADLFDQMIADSAYAFELRGPRRAQAWENVKKLRSLVRRIQNRGYATLARIAEFLDCLHAGDESNAVIDALEAVNLMTVHASKGLEFPVVFVVNLSKGVGAPPPPVRVVDDAGEEPLVAVGRYVSDTQADDEEKMQDTEETKRLLYVAFTRARDRLYLASVLKDGEFHAGPGSLGSVMPASLARVVESAGGGPGLSRVEWVSASGRPHVFRVCSAAPVERIDGPVEHPAPTGTTDDFSQVSGVDVPARVAVTRHLASAHGTLASDAEAAATPRLAGVLVHGLFRLSAPIDDADTLRRLAAALVGPESRGRSADVEAAIDEAVATYAAMRAREDVRSLFEQGDAWFEVPFSWRVDSTILRGTIDCLIQRPDGSVIVVDFKTGRESASHRSQLKAYVTATRLLFPGRPVEGVLLYP